MKEYTSDAPVFSESIPVVETNDLVNAENNNAAAKQLLQNILVLQALKVNKEEGKGLVSDAEKKAWNAIYEQAIGYVDQKIAELINGAPSTLDTLGEIAAAMAKDKDVVEALEEAIGKKANQAEMDSLLGLKLDTTGDSKDNTVTFTSSDTTTPSAWTEVETLKSGESHRSILQKISMMFRNARYLWRMLGKTDISAIGDGTVTGALSALNDNLTVETYTITLNPTSYIGSGSIIEVYKIGKLLFIHIRHLPIIGAFPSWDTTSGATTYKRIEALGNFGFVYSDCVVSRLANPGASLGLSINNSNGTAIVVSQGGASSAGNYYGIAITTMPDS